MGCIFSHDEDKKKIKQPTGQGPNRKPPQSLNRNSQHQIVQANEQKVPTLATPTKNGVTPVSNNNQSLRVGEEEDPEQAFRRQHFDRNSVLRHSKKRKKSNVSNPASPGPAFNGTLDSTVDVSTQERTQSSSPTPALATLNVSFTAPTAPSVSVPPIIPIQIVPTSIKPDQEANQIIPVEELQSTGINDVILSWDHDSPIQDDSPAEQADPVKQVTPEIMDDSQHLSASARVAALLAGPVVQPMSPTVQDPVQIPFTNGVKEEEEDLISDLEAEDAPEETLIHAVIPTPPQCPSPPPPFVTPQESPVPSPDHKVQSIFNGNDSKTIVTSTPMNKGMLISANKNSSTPSRIPKLASGSSVSAHSKLAKTPSGGKANQSSKGTNLTPSSVGGTGAGRLVLRTRRQVALEMEEQERNKNRFDKNSANHEDNEDCGRLI